MKLLYPAISLDHSNPITFKEHIGGYLIRTFRTLGVETEIAFYRNDFVKYIFGFSKLFYELIKRKNYILSREPLLLKSLSYKINTKINKSDADAIFAFGTNPVAYLKTNKPIYFLSDLTFDNLLNYYSDYDNLPNDFIQRSHQLEIKAFQKARRIFLSSEFAIKSAVEFYGVNPDKIVQVPLGANISYSPDKIEIETIINEKTLSPLKLLIIGQDWHRKGIDIGIKIFEKIQSKINNCELTIIGCKAPQKFKATNKGIRIIERIDKSTEIGSQYFSENLKQTHFLLFPSRAEGFGHVISEANAFGIPVVANNTGGIPCAIDNGVNGFVFDLFAENGIEIASNKIIELYNNKTQYKKLSFNSYTTYSSKLNWKSICKVIIATIENTKNE